MIITIGNREYDVTLVDTPEEMKKGLSNKDSLPKNEGMLFKFADEKNQRIFNTMDMEFPIDIIFINDEREVVLVCDNEQPGLGAIISEPQDYGVTNYGYIEYVLEVNPNSGILIGDILEMEDDDEPPVMKVLAADGSTLMDLWGGERIVSRRETKVLISKAKKILPFLKKKHQSIEEEEKLSSLYKSLGKYMFKVLKGQNTRPSEYVESPS